MYKTPFFFGFCSVSLWYMDIQTLLTGVLTFINATLIPFVLAVAFLMFLWNITRYFIIEGANEKEHENAKSLALYGILAFVIISSIWGIVNLFVGDLGLSGKQPITPDYMKTGGAGGSQNASDPYACTGPDGLCLEGSNGNMF
jgi:hypothetical protein